MMRQSPAHARSNHTHTHTVCMHTTNRPHATPHKPGPTPFDPNLILRFRIGQNYAAPKSEVTAVEVFIRAQRAWPEVRLASHPTPCQRWDRPPGMAAVDHVLPRQCLARVHQRSAAAAPAWVAWVALARVAALSNAGA